MCLHEHHLAKQALSPGPTLFDIFLLTLFAAERLLHFTDVSAQWSTIRSGKEKLWKAD